MRTILILTTFHLDTVNIEFVEVLVPVIGNTGRPPDVEIRHLVVPGTVAGVPLAYSKGFPAQMIFREQLVCILVIVGVGKEIHPGSVIEHTVSVADTVGNQLGLNYFRDYLSLRQAQSPASIVPL